MLTSPLPPSFSSRLFSPFIAPRRKVVHVEDSTDGSPKPRGNPDTDPVSFDPDPVLLIPGIGGSILNAVKSDGSSERVWIRLVNADKEFRTKLWSKYNPETGRSETLCPDTHIRVPEDNFGLFSCDLLDPSLALPVDAVNYFHSMIEQMRHWGLKDGETLFGFGYDFRQSNRLPETMGRLLAKLRGIFEKFDGKRKVNIVSHSMGGLVVKSLLLLHGREFEAYVGKWVSIGAPFQGAPGFITDTLLTGVEFVSGWQKQLFITKWSIHQLMVECPSVYELMTNFSHEGWRERPRLKVVWRKKKGKEEREGEEGRERETRGNAEDSGNPGAQKRNIKSMPKPSCAWPLPRPPPSTCGSLSPSPGSENGVVEWWGRGEEKGKGEEGELEYVVEEQIYESEEEIWGLMKQVLRDNKADLSGTHIPLPLNRHLVELAKISHDLWNGNLARVAIPVEHTKNSELKHKEDGVSLPYQHLMERGREKREEKPGNDSPLVSYPPLSAPPKPSLPPSGFEFYSVYGTGLDTAYHCCYGSTSHPIDDASDILKREVAFDFVDGDGTVPVDSALGDGLNPIYRVGVSGEHRALLRDERVFRLVKFFLKMDGEEQRVMAFPKWMEGRESEKGREKETENSGQFEVKEGVEGGEESKGEGEGDLKGEGVEPAVSAIGEGEMVNDEISDERRGGVKEKRDENEKGKAKGEGLERERGNNKHVVSVVQGSGLGQCYYDPYTDFVFVELRNAEEREGEERDCRAPITVDGL